MKETKKDNFGWTDLLKAILFLFGDLKKKYVLGVIILFFIGLYNIVPPLIIGKVVDFFISYSKGQPLTVFYIYIAILGVSYSLVSFIRLSLKRYIDNLQTEAIYKIKVKGFEQLLNFSIRWHDKENTGNKVYRIENGLTALKDVLYLFKDNILVTISSVVGIVGVFIFLNPLYILFFVIYLIGFVIILKYFYTKTREITEEYNQAIERAGGSYIEGLSNILTIKTLGATSSFKEHISNKEAITKQFELDRRKNGMNMWKVFQAFNGVCHAAFLLLVGYGVINQEISTGAIVIFYGYLQKLIENTGGVLSIYEKFIQSKSGVGRMMPIFQAEEVNVKHGNLPFPSDWKTISLKNANFSYSSKDAENQHTLSNINLNIERNQKIGIVGKTGSGKSTLSKLLMGLYRFDSGSYLIGDKNFNDIDSEELNDKLAIVLQDSEMFNLSLKENITLLKKTKPEVLQKVIKISQLEDVIKKLPNGVDTLIGEKGYHLSGGERQRVGIARAICKNPEIMILDEATSSLDSKTEHLVHSGIEKELVDKTIIIIAHRVTTLKVVDKIYVFKKGKIVEDGTFEELSHNPKSIFSSIYNQQV